MPWSEDLQRTGIKMWTYEQSVASSTWSINHGMGAKTSVEVVTFDDNNNLQRIPPVSVVQVDDNNTTITWSSPRKGFATFVSLR